MSSRRNYVTIAEVLAATGLTVTDAQIDEAEALIDQYAGFITKDFLSDAEGRAVSATSNTLTLQTDQQNVWDIDYLKRLEIEILGGTGEGQIRQITGSTRAGVITVNSDWDTTPDSTSFYRIYQYAKFPRRQDVKHYSQATPFQYYKQIPGKVKEAVFAQLAFINQMGDAFFDSNKGGFKREQIGDYEYEMADSQTGAGINNLIAPQAKHLLKGIRCIVGGL